MSGAMFAKGYRAAGVADKNMGALEMWRHYTTRGHKGPVTCVRANANASIIVTGGVDYSMRVWYENGLFEAYECVAVLNVPVPVPLSPPELSVVDMLRELVVPKKIEWATEPKHGVTCVHPLCDVDPEKGMFRNGPILCGTGHGSVHVLDLGGGPNTVTNMDGLHSDSVNDICALKVMESGDLVEFLLLTGGEDGLSTMLRLKTRATPRPEFHSHEKFGKDGHLVDTLFFGGGGRREHTQQLAQSKDAQEGTWLQMVDLVKERVLDHSESPQRCPVLECHALAPHPGEAELISFVTLTKLGLHLRNAAGDENIFLRIQASQAKKYAAESYADSGFQARAVDCTEHLSLASMCQHRKVGHGSQKRDRQQAVLFLAGHEPVKAAAAEEATKSGRVAVWCLQDGVVGVQADHGGLIFARDHVAEGIAKLRAAAAGVVGGARPTDLEPLCVYDQDGSNLDVDKSGLSTSFAVQLREDRTTVDMWTLEAVPEDMLVIAPDGPQNLLVCPGQERTELQMGQKAPVWALQVVDTGRESALVVGCENSCAYMWDLAGRDRGQIYAEMRSMSAVELLYPPFEVVITALQLLAFAFGPPPNQEKETTQAARKSHIIVGSFDFGYSREELFWPEVKVVTGAMVAFLMVALLGLDERMDRLVAMAYDLPAYKAEKFRFSPMHLVVAVLSTARNMTYLFMQLSSTVLVVPIVKIVSAAMHCVEDEDFGGLVVNSAPHLQCFDTSHVKVVLLFVALAPLYLFLLIPFGVVAGDAHYVPHECMFEWRFWQEKNAWRLAAARKATTVHQAFLHLNPRYAFQTLLVVLGGKIMMPTIATLTKSVPLLQMFLIAGVNFGMWFSTMVYAPYVDRKFSVLVQDMKLMIFCASFTGIITVAMDDADSKVPLVALCVFVSMTLCMLVTQLYLLTTTKPTTQLHDCGLPGPGAKATTASRSSEVVPLLGADQTQPEKAEK